MAGEFVWIILLFVLFVVIAVAVGIYAYIANKRRREAFQALAGAQGWTYIEKDGFDRPRRFLGWSPFGQGHSQVALNAVAGSHDGLPFEAFTYRYTTTTHGSKGQRQDHHHHYRIVVATMPIPAPDLKLSREHWGHKVYDALGGSDIDFESDEFSRKFWVQCGDRKFAYDCIDAAMMEWLLGEPSATSWSWRWHGERLMFMRTGVLEAAEVLPALALVQQFIARLPRVLFADQAKRPRPVGRVKA